MRPNRWLATFALFAVASAGPVLAQQDPPAPAPVTTPTVDPFAKASAEQPFPLATLPLPPLPDLPTLSELEPGVFFAAVQVTWPRGSSRVWIYLPATTSPAHSLPCVLVAPAGSNLLFGMELADGDRVEHLPYVKAGFAVIAYEVEGAMPTEEQQTDANVLCQLRRFVDCWAGLQDAHLALEYALAKVPAIDPQQIFAAGHSSAATLTLLFAAHEPRLCGAVAFAPITDVQKRIPAEAQDGLEADFAGYRNFLARSSPSTHTSRLEPPLFVFAAQDDSNVPFADTKAFVARLRQANRTVEFDSVPTGDHYQSMIDTGLPNAVAWMQALLAKRAKQGLPLTVPPNR